jgi:hypothetical protein
MYGLQWTAHLVVVLLLLLLLLLLLCRHVPQC